MGNFQTRLQSARERLGMTVKALAAVADVNYSYLYRLEAGRSSPTLPVVDKLAGALGVDAGWLAFGGE